MRQMIVSEYHCFGVAWPDDMIQIFGEDIDRDSPDACEHVIKMKKLNAEERRKAIYEYYRLKINPEGRVDSDLCGSSERFECVANVDAKIDFCAKEIAREVSTWYDTLYVAQIPDEATDCIIMDYEDGSEYILASINGSIFRFDPDDGIWKRPLVIE